MLSRELEVTLNLAFKNAREKKHEFMTVEHLLLALLDDASASSVLKACGADLSALRADLNEFITSTVPTIPDTKLQQDTQPTHGFQRVLQRAVFQVNSANHSEVLGANVIVAIFSEQESQAVYFLRLQDVARIDVVNYIAHGISKVNDGSDESGGSIPKADNKTQSSKPEQKTSLEMYATNLNEKAEKGEIDPLIGRDFEVERIRSGVLNNPNIDKIDEYVTEIENEYKNYSVLSSKFGKIKDDNKSIISLINKSSNYKDYISQQNAIQKSINQIDVFISGNKSKKDVMEKDVETISNRLSVATRGINSSYGPTGMQIASLTKAKSLIIKLGEMIDNLNLEFTKLKNQVESELDSFILD